MGRGPRRPGCPGRDSSPFEQSLLLPAFSAPDYSTSTISTATTSEVPRGDHGGAARPGQFRRCSTSGPSSMYRAVPRRQYTSDSPTDGPVRLDADQYNYHALGRAGDSPVLPRLRVGVRHSPWPGGVLAMYTEHTCAASAQTFARLRYRQAVESAGVARPSATSPARVGMPRSVGVWPGFCRTPRPPRRSSAPPK